MATATTTRRSPIRAVALLGMVASIALFSSACTLSDVSSILSILRLFGVL
jgi:hypothetical protein